MPSIAMIANRVRWPLMHQILWPLLFLILATHVGLYWVTINSITSRKHDELRQRLASIAETAGELNVPLNASVLGLLKGLSGAEFQVVDLAGNVVASTLEKDLDTKLAILPNERSGKLGSSIQHQPGIESWFLAETVSLNRPPHDRKELRIFCSLEGLHQEQADAVRPVILTGACSLLIATSLSVFWALRIGKPIASLQEKIDQVISGPFEPVSLPQRNDELYDLAVAFNQIGDRLIEYESTIRRTEQVRLLGMVRSGIAHQLRNAITGTRIALEIHHDQLVERDHLQRLNTLESDREGLEIAFHQLDFMERFLKQFLVLDSRSKPVKATIEVSQMIQEVVKLVQPNARHLNISMDIECIKEPLSINADQDQIQQAILNLLVNALESAAQRNCDVSTQPPGWVQLAIDQVDADTIEIKVRDNGGGFSEDEHAQLQQPFFSTKPDGIGLGLSVVQQVIQAHQGAFDLSYENGITTASLRLPSINRNHDPTIELDQPERK